MLTGQIICQDTLTAMQALADDSVQLIFADPPYWMRVEGTLHRVEGGKFNGCDDAWDNQFTDLADYDRFTEQWLTECRRVLHPNGSLWVIGGMQCIYSIGAIMQRLGFWIISDVIWQKSNPTPNFKGTRLTNSHETLIWATKSDKSRFTFNYHTAKHMNMDTVSVSEHGRGIRKQMGSVWRIAVCQGAERMKNSGGLKLHSTQKPEELLTRIIALSSRLGDTVLDPFGGTMTTAAVAKRLGRNFIAIDSNPTYCEYGRQRVDAVTEEITDIAKATYDIKPVPVSMQKLLAAGLLVEGESVYFRNGEREVKLNHQAKLEFDDVALDIHRAAATMSNASAPRLNGFLYWFVMRDGSRVSLNELRIRYRQQHGL